MARTHTDAFTCLGRLPRDLVQHVCSSPGECAQPLSWFIFDGFLTRAFPTYQARTRTCNMHQSFAANDERESSITKNENRPAACKATADMLQTAAILTPRARYNIPTTFLSILPQLFHYGAHSSRRGNRSDPPKRNARHGSSDIKPVEP